MTPQDGAPRIDCVHLRINHITPDIRLCEDCGVYLVDLPAASPAPGAPHLSARESQGSASKSGPSEPENSPADSLPSSGAPDIPALLKRISAANTALEKVAWKLDAAGFKVLREVALMLVEVAEVLEAK
jgi:hypothetical protein